MGRKITRAGKTGKRYHFELSRTSVFLWSFGAFVLLAWIFTLGVLAGRGLLPEGVNAFVYEKSNRSVEHFSAYSLMENPMTSCGCFECILAIVPEANGVMAVNREYTGMTPIGMTFSTLASSVGGGAQTPGFIGVGRLYLSSPKFLASDGGIKRLVWMPKALKEGIRERFQKEADRIGEPDLLDKIATEEDAMTEEEVAEEVPGEEEEEPEVIQKGKKEEEEEGEEAASAGGGEEES
jgi:CO dehydrogenase/acetyl-CoA synthase beta subunit